MCSFLVLCSLYIIKAISIFNFMDLDTNIVNLPLKVHPVLCEGGFGEYHFLIKEACESISELPSDNILFEKHVGGSLET